MSMRVSEVTAKEVRNRIKDNKRKLEMTTGIIAFVLSF
jgi:hypothetical protein